MSFTVAMTGASGLQYGMKLVQCLLQQEQQVNLLLTSAAYVVADMELGLSLPGNPARLKQFLAEHWDMDMSKLSIYHNNDWSAPIASGTTTCEAMVIVPCTSGCLAAVASGMSDNLIERAADVMLKEGKRLILVHRETPLSAIHLENSLTLVRAGATIMPANPGFYHRPETVDDMVDFMVARILDHLKVPHQLMARWGED